MNPLDAANYFATLIGLICNWKAERGAQATDRFDDFLVYLSEHHFEVLRAEIVDSRELQTQLRGLLMLNLSSMSEQLNLISQGMASLASKLDTLAPLTRTLGTSEDGISPQALGILKAFDQSGATSMIRNGGDGFNFMPGNSGIRISERRFLDSDMQSLIEFGFLRRDQSVPTPFQGFTLTRLGSNYAKQLPELPLATT